MVDKTYMLDYGGCQDLLRSRLNEPAPGRIQILTGPRQVGKTTLLLALAAEFGDLAVYSAMDGPEAAVTGYLDRLFVRVEQLARSKGKAILLLDEIQHLGDWSVRLKGHWDRILRLATPIHVVVSGSSALGVGRGSRESLAGRFERLTMSHWTASGLVAWFDMEPEDAVREVAARGVYPGAMVLRTEPERWRAYIRDAIIEPAIGRDIVALASIRRPALLRQVFVLAASSPAQIVALQKLQGQLQDRGALETIASYLGLLEEAYLVAAFEKHSTRPIRRRAAPPKIVVLNNALCAATASGGIGTSQPEVGALLENACLAFAWASGQRVRYWRETQYEVDAVLDGSWGQWAVEIKSGSFGARDLRGLFRFTARHPEYRPLVVCDRGDLPTADALGVGGIAWQDFLLSGPP